MYSESRRWLSMLLMMLASVASASPGKVVPDANSIAVWHFEEDLGGGVAFNSETGTHMLIPSGSAPTISTSAGYNQFGRAVSGFNATSGLETSTAGDPKTQTFEAWISWRSDSHLPGVYANEQVIMANLVGSTFSTRLAVENGQLTLQVRSGDGAADIKTAAVPISAEAHRWYHVAYTLQAAHLGGSASIEDVRVNLYWSTEDALRSNPTPVAQTQWLDFPYRANGWKLRLGKRFFTGNDEFKGQIDEVHYSNAVRTTFGSLIAGDPARYQPSRAFVMSAIIFGPGTPDVSAYGIRKAAVISPQFWKPGANISTDFPSRPHTLAAAASSISSNGADKLYYLNVEHLPTDTYSSTQQEWSDSIQKLAAIPDWIHQANPQIRLGWYMILPDRNYWNRSGVTGDQWRARNEFFKALADHVDMVYPSLYTFYGVNAADRTGWVDYAVDNLAEAKRYNKPVYAVLWPEYHGSNPQGCAGKPIDGDFWRRQLETAYQHADGIMIWAGNVRPWTERIDTTPNACSSAPPVCDWWCQTQQFVQQKGLGN